MQFLILWNFIQEITRFYLILRSNTSNYFQCGDIIISVCIFMLIYRQFKRVVFNCCVKVGKHLIIMFIVVHKSTERKYVNKWVKYKTFMAKKNPFMVFHVFFFQIFQMIFFFPFRFPNGLFIFSGKWSTALIEHNHFFSSWMRVASFVFCTSINSPNSFVQNKK